MYRKNSSLVDMSHLSSFFNDMYNSNSSNMYNLNTCPILLPVLMYIHAQKVLHLYIPTCLKSTPTMQLIMLLPVWLCYIVSRDLRINLSDLGMCQKETLPLQSHLLLHIVLTSQVNMCSLAIIARLFRERFTS